MGIARDVLFCRDGDFAQTNPRTFYFSCDGTGVLAHVSRLVGAWFYGVATAKALCDTVRMAAFGAVGVGGGVDDVVFLRGGGAAFECGGEFVVQLVDFSRDLVVAVARRTGKCATTKRFGFGAFGCDGVVAARMVGTIVAGHDGGFVVVDAGGFGVFPAASARQTERTCVADGVLHVLNWHDFQRGVEYILRLARAQLGIAAICFRDKRFGVHRANRADLGVCGREKRDRFGTFILNRCRISFVGVFRF